MQPERSRLRPKPAVTQPSALVDPGVTGAVLLLAAGTGSRFGSDKRIARTSSGQRLLSATIRLYTTLGWPIYVVVRDHEQHLRAQVERELPETQAAVLVRWVTAPLAELGMGHSLAAGVTALLDQGHDRALVGLADMPFAKPDTLIALRDALCAPTSAPKIIRPRYRQHPGNPLGFSGNMLRALTDASGDTGARPLLAEQAASITWVDVDDPGILQDVDEPGDLQPK